MSLLQFPLAFIEGLGGPEIMLILVIVLVLFGGEKLPGFARGLGKSIREFKKAAAGVEEEFKRALEEDENKKNLPLPPVPTTFPPYPPAVSHLETPAVNQIEAPASPPSTVAHTEAPPADLSTTPPVAPETPPPTKPTPPPTHGDHLP